MTLRHGLQMAAASAGEVPTAVHETGGAGEVAPLGVLESEFTIPDER